MSKNYLEIHPENSTTIILHRKMQNKISRKSLRKSNCKLIVDNNNQLLFRVHRNRKSTTEAKSA